MPDKSYGPIPPDVPDRDIPTERVITPTIAQLMAKREQRMSERYFPAIPLTVVQRGIAAHALGPVALQIIAMHQRVSGQDAVRIRPSILEALGIGRRRWLRVLAALEAAGLVAAKTHPGRASLVGITDAEYLKWLKFKN